MNIDSPDKRFYGIYRGFVYSSNDPEDQGRVQLVVPQVLGSEVTEWAYPIGGAIAQKNWPYGTFYSVADQAIGVNTATVINGWAALDTSRTYLDVSRIYVQETGDYFVKFSAMFIKTTANSGTANLWFRVNGTNVDDSNTKATLAGNNSEVSMSRSLILDLEAGDYIEFVASANSTNTFLSHDNAGVGPEVPGIIATLNLLGKWKPQPNQGVWVMFEGGDPNFPLWIGGS
jgi:hypothetical protein